MYVHNIMIIFIPQFPPSGTYTPTKCPPFQDYALADFEAQYEGTHLLFRHSEGWGGEPLSVRLSWASNTLWLKEHKNRPSYDPAIPLQINVCQW